MWIETLQDAVKGQTDLSELTADLKRSLTGYGPAAQRLCSDHMTRCKYTDVQTTNVADDLENVTVYLLNRYGQVLCRRSDPTRTRGFWGASIVETCENARRILHGSDGEDQVLLMEEDLGGIEDLWHAITNVHPSNAPLARMFSEYESLQRDASALSGPLLEAQADEMRSRQRMREAVSHLTKMVQLAASFSALLHRLQHMSQHPRLSSLASHAPLVAPADYLAAYEDMTPITSRLGTDPAEAARRFTLLSAQLARSLNRSGLSVEADLVRRLVRHAVSWATM